MTNEQLADYYAMIARNNARMNPAKAQHYRAMAKMMMKAS